MLAQVLRFAGLLVTVVGLWLSAGGLRLIVSGRIDERRRAASGLKCGLPIVVVGLLLLFGGMWLGAAHQ